MYFCMISMYMSAQSMKEYTWEQFVEQYAEDNFDDGEYDDDLMQELYELYIHPLNLNTISEQDLHVFPFLSESQICDIMDYIDANRPLLSTGELMSLRSLDYNTRHYLQLFCHAGTDPVADSLRIDRRSWRHVTAKKILQYGSNELTARTDIPLYTSAGYAKYPAAELESSPNKVYQGNRLYHSVRYMFSSMKHVEAGLQIEKDAGERGIDFFSAYAILRDMGMIRALAVGDYKVSFGQGLVVNTAGGFGKMMTYNSLGRMDRGIRKHSSTSEANYMSGAALSLNLTPYMYLTAFYSHRNEDGTLSAAAPNAVSSVLTDGYHRTALERSKKGNLANTTYGANLHLAVGDVHLGATAVRTTYSKYLYPKYDTPSSLYRLYNPQGRDFAAYGLSYSYVRGILSMRGETAMSHSYRVGVESGELSTKEAQNGYATINSIQLRATRQDVFTLLQRYYGAKYATIYAKSFAENSRTQNESGVFLSWTHSSESGVSIESYVDFVHFPWLKYQVSGSSNTVEGMMQIGYEHSDRLNFSLRYRLKSRQMDLTLPADDDETTMLSYRTTHNVRLQANYSLTSHLAMRTTATAVMSHFPSRDDQWGYMLSQHLSWTDAPRHKRFQMTLSYFDTDSYDARLYAYEPSLLYSFGMMSYYYRGVRGVLLASMPIARRLYLTAKVASTHYFDRDNIGTGLDLISANHREDVQLQLRWRF